MASTSPLFRDASLVLDDEARVVHCSDDLLALTGWTRDEVVGFDFFERFLPRPHDILRGVFALLLADDPNVWTYDNEIVTRRGERRLIHWENCVVRSSGGRVVGTASVAHDITVRARQPVAADLAIVRPGAPPLQRREVSPEAIAALADELHVDPGKAGPVLIHLIAEHCAQLAEECAPRASAQDAADTIRLSFALFPHGEQRH